ncbi:hypothetical protein OJAV_G00022450 [Oryzias javanicus]|uniref:Uncharacterized protein n=1 Tax=Oryzias javanicus TaxID=123683 RepID=A0A437DHF9_ORYJA|nr:hypothetical protein OJAV_G00022450 [Oryzias javanicus]
MPIPWDIFPPRKDSPASSFILSSFHPCTFWTVKQHKDCSRPDQTTPQVPVSMEAKTKPGAPKPKAASQAEKKEPAAARKAEPTPTAPEAEKPPASQDGAAEAEAAAAGDETAASGTNCLEHLTPFLIGGVVIAAGAILLGAVLLAKRN